MFEEIERKYLIDRIPENLDHFPSAVVSQGYLVIDSDDREVRIRRSNAKYSLAFKEGRGLSRTEIEILITEQQFEVLWEGTEGRRINKTRHYVPYEHYRIEVDRYGDNLNGLITAEVEFESVGESLNFYGPDWLGIEITDDARYKNSNLARFGLPEE